MCGRLASAISACPVPDVCGPVFAQLHSCIYWDDQAEQSHGCLCISVALVIWARTNCYCYGCCYMVLMGTSNNCFGNPMRVMGFKSYYVLGTGHKCCNGEREPGLDLFCEMHIVHYQLAFFCRIRCVCLPPQCLHVTLLCNHNVALVRVASCMFGALARR